MKIHTPQYTEIDNSILLLQKCLQLCDRDNFLHTFLNQSLDMIILWYFKQVCENLGLDRTIYVRYDASLLSWVLCVDNVGHGISQAPEATYCVGDVPHPDELEFNKWTFCPTEDIGVDAVYKSRIFRREGEEPYTVAIGFDQTNDARKFTEIERRYMDLFAENFINTIQSKLHLENQKKDARRAYVDDMTGLFNRRYFTEYTRESEFVSAKKKCFVMVDIDHFKQLNDVYGHLIGDAIIKALSNLLKQIPNSISFRVGGEEFLIIFYGTSEETISVMNNVLEIWKNLKLECLNGKNGWKQSVSGGIASVNSEYLPSEAWANADAALYESKRAGRGRFTIANPNIKVEKVLRVPLSVVIKNIVEESVKDNNTLHEGFVLLQRIIAAKQDGTLVFSE